MHHVLRTSFVRASLALLLPLQLFGQSTPPSVRELIPATAPVGARIFVAGRGLDDPAVGVTFSGSSSSAAVIQRTDPLLKVFESAQPLTDGARLPERAVVTLEATDANGIAARQLIVDGVELTVPATITTGGAHALVAVARDRASNETRLERTFFIGAGTSCSRQSAAIQRSCEGPSRAPFA